jgi:DegV family protein with EDD domain
MPRDYAIVTDTTSSLLPSQLEEYNILAALSATVQVGGREFKHYCDAREMSFEDFYAELAAGVPTSTSAVNPDAWEGELRPLLAEGKDILILPFSSALSATCDNARIVVESLKEEFPDAAIEIVDSLCADFGQGLFVIHAAKNRQNGMSIAENAKWCEENRLKFCHWFTVDDLHHLRRGGRVSGATAIIGSVLGIKPELHVDNEGRLVKTGAERGRKRALLALIDKLAETAIEPETQTMFLSHANCREEADFVADEIKKRYGTKEVVINYTGPVAAAHSGPGTMALFFIGKER